ncbi:MAG: UvrB/UvrC motif-containing protein [bacterium]|nr:UvrB/UvrC motif-containing protein [bacterium]
MLCQDCQEREASIHYTQIIHNQKSELHVCKECAEKRGLLAEETQYSFPLANLVAGLVADIDAKMTKQKQRRAGEKEKECPHCGLNYSAFKERGLLGCSNCYQVFNEELTQILRKIHGHIQHAGKTPVKISAQIQAGKEIQKLREDLSRAIQTEEFEEAARVRDKIREIEKELT